MVGLEKNKKSQNKNIQNKKRIAYVFLKILPKKKEKRQGKQRIIVHKFETKIKKGDCSTGLQQPPPPGINKTADIDTQQHTNTCTKLI